MDNNTSTKKQGNNIRGTPAPKALPTKDVNYRDRKPVNAGQLRNTASERFADPMNKGGIVAPIGGLEGLHNDIGEMSGFITTGYLDKGETPYGEDAKFNFLPPGMDISNQQNAEIHEMPMRTLTATSYPGDGWKPTPRDIEE